MVVLNEKEQNEYYASQNSAANPLSPEEWYKQTKPAPVSGGIASSEQGVELVQKAQQKEAKLNPVPVQQAQTQPSGQQSTASQPASQPAQSTGTAVTLINPQTEQTVTFNDAAINRENIQSYINSGYQVSEANGQVPSWLSPQGAQPKSFEEQKLERDRSDYEAAKQKVLNFDVSKDPALQGILSGITAKWDQRIKDMEEVNRSRKAAVSTTGVRLGSRWTGGSGGMFGGIIAEEERQGIERIGELEGAKQQALTQAKAAYESKEWDKYVKFMDIAEKKYSESLKAVSELQEKAAEEQKKIQEKLDKIKEQEIRASRDSAISDLMQQGITDPLQLLNYLNFDEAGNMIGDFSFKEITDITSKMKEAEKVAPGVVGEWLAAKENDPNLADITLEDYLNLKDPGRGLELTQKRLTIAKLQKELDDNGMGGQDASNLIAYAQQYAATGMIPPGIPKGTFGLVAQTAKEMPRATGTIVNTQTGVADGKAPATEQQDYGRLYNILNNVKRLKELDQKRIGGVVSGSLGYVTGSDAQTDYLAVRKAIVDDISRMQSGAALTAEEVAFYEDYLPGRFSEKFFLGADSQNKIENFEKIMDNRLRERLSTNSLAMYGYSKVKAGGTEYTVGDVIKNGKGQTGRVNADGSITIIE